MASEYLKWKYKDVQPDEPPPPLKGWAKVKNWLYYNKLWIIAGAVLTSILGSILVSALGIGQVKPDYIFAYVGDNKLPDEAASRLTEGLEALGEDVNGDGRVTVELRQYALNPDGDAETALQYSYAADVTLIADIEKGDSYFFIVEEPMKIQLSYGIFACPDGSPPAENDRTVDDKAFSCGDLAALAALEIPELNGLYIGRRCFYDDPNAENHASDAALWQILTEGVLK